MNVALFIDSTTENKVAFGRKQMTKWFIISDVHGRYDLLTGLLKKWESEFSGHRLAFLGDMVDRGPDSFQTVDTIKKLTKKGAIALLGNHEAMMLDYFHNKWVDKNDIWMYNGGGKTVDSYGKATKLYGHAKFFEAFSKTHAKWMEKLPLNYEDDELWLSHAPIPKAEYWSRNSRHRDYRIDKWACTWTYHGENGGTEESVAMDHGKLAVCGHVHALREGILLPRVYGDPVKPKIVYADTGCGCWEGAPLSAIIVEGGEYKGFIQESPELVSWA